MLKKGVTLILALLDAVYGERRDMLWASLHDVSLPRLFPSSPTISPPSECAVAPCLYKADPLHHGTSSKAISRSCDRCAPHASALYNSSKLPVFWLSITLRHIRCQSYIYDHIFTTHCYLLTLISTSIACLESGEESSSISQQLNIHSAVRPRR